MDYDFKFTKPPWDVRFTSIDANHRVRIYQNAYAGVCGEDDKLAFDEERIANAKLIAVSVENIYRLIESTKLLESILDGKIEIKDLVKQIDSNKHGIYEAHFGKKEQRKR